MLMLAKLVKKMNSKMNIHNSKTFSYIVQLRWQSGKVYNQGTFIEARYDIFFSEIIEYYQYHEWGTGVI